MKHAKLFVLLALLGVVIAGCTEPTTLAFKKPTGTKMMLQGTEYTWPVTVTLERPTDVNQKQQYTADLTIPSDQGMIKVAAEITMFPFKDTGGETLNVVTLDSGQLKDLYTGKSVTIRAKTEEDNIPKYTIEFNKK
jgi:hypothetical protein